jgi:hypothetical protein
VIPIMMLGTSISFRWPKILEVGDSHELSTPCESVVRATITTDRGSATYRFTN